MFGARSCTRLMTASKMVRSYETVNHAIPLSKMTWSHNVNNFQGQWKSLEDKKKNYKTDVPVITKALPVIKWTKEF